MKTIYKVAIGVILFILAFTLWQECTTDYVLKDRETTVTVDTTAIDSLSKQVEYWRNIAESKRDTVIDTVEVVEYRYVDEETKEYTSTYEDSVLSATWKTNIVGLLKSQIFEYSIKKERVIEKTNTVTLTKTKTITNTERYVEEPNPYFSVGAFGGQHSLGPSLSYNTKHDYRITYRYNTLLNSHEIGVEIPIKFNLF